MKTAEEILLKRLFPNTTRKILNDANVEYKVNNARHREILAAMEEYASEQCQKRDEVIEILEQITKQINSWASNITDASFVKLGSRYKQLKGELNKQKP